VFIGWLVMLLLVVQFAGHLSRSVRRHRRKLVRQNRRIRAMSRRLKRHQRALVQHEKMVALGQMAAGVAHEIANPLASMDSLLQLMQRKPERLTGQTVGTLREQVDRINQIIQQMTRFAHPVDSEWSWTPLNEVAAQALRMARMDKRFRSVRVVEDYAPEIGEVRMLPHAMQQVLVNLMINAADAMAGRAEPTLTVRTRSVSGTNGKWEVEDEPNGQWAVIEVTDNGQGIRPEHLHRIFEPFFTTKPVGQGTGLGLSISYSLMRKQGGRLEVRSEVGKGSTFTAWLPISASRMVEARPPALEGPALRSNSAELGSESGERHG
jgi:signal transduction histidine kinase